ncbi:unnamed protein product [Nezara viridula]|uniref:Neuropeptide n=1 Tax=Nezara viridula TaxID=85310 RepID=A0A9P0H8R1_NEZVI|nr:unnamed protein product [Nezara viridula]
MILQLVLTLRYALVNPSKAVRWSVAYCSSVGASFMWGAERQSSVKDSSGYFLRIDIDLNGHRLKEEANRRARGASMNRLCANIGRFDIPKPREPNHSCRVCHRGRRGYRGWRLLRWELSIALLRPELSRTRRRRCHAAEPSTSCLLHPVPIVAAEAVAALDFPKAGFRSSSQGQANSAVAAKEHPIVHLCLGLALRKP